MSSNFIGIDGGGTTTRLVVQHDNEAPEYFERQISLKVRDGDFAASAEKLREILVGANGVDPSSANRAAVGPYGDEGYAIAIGLSGMSREEDQESLKAAIHALPEFAESKIHIESDATMTLKAVLPEGQEGILLIAGTGSVIFYQPSGGPARRIGGWGPLLSDEGSGYRIGLRALRYYVNMLDGVYPRDMLINAMDARIEAKTVRGSSVAGIESVTPKSLTKLAEIDPAFVASFAQDVYEAAVNDPNAPVRRHMQDMINEELIDLTIMLFPLTIPGVMSGNMPYNLYLAGSVARQPMTIRIIEQAYEDYRDNYFNLQLVDGRTAAYKALEIAKGLPEA